jgi:hypothetical protein
MGAKFPRGNIWAEWLLFQRELAGERKRERSPAC